MIVITTAFIDIVLDQGCLLLDDFLVDDERVIWLLSRNQTRKVSINCADDSMTLQTANDLLVLLELEDVIGRLPTNN